MRDSDISKSNPLEAPCIQYNIAIEHPGKTSRFFVVLEGFLCPSDLCKSLLPVAEIADLYSAKVARDRQTRKQLDAL